MARVSNGEALPDGTAVVRGEAAFFTSEDGAADTIRPRLDLLGANPAKVHHFDCVMKDGKDFGLNLARDAGKLRRWLTANPNIRLIIFDPITAFLGGRVDSHKNAEVRRVLGPLKRLAEDFRVAIIGINHLSKADMKAVYRGQGSIAFNAQARAVWQVTEDPDNMDRRLFLPVKMNLAQTSGLGFRISDKGLHWEEGKVDLTPDQVDRPAKPDSRLNETKEWLKDLLEKNNRKLPAKDVEAKADAAGLSWRTMKRAKQALGVRSVKETTKDGPRFAWTLPAEKTQAPDSWKNGKAVAALKKTVNRRKRTNRAKDSKTYHVGPHETYFTQKTPEETKHEMEQPNIQVLLA